ncbi:hypothetical protein [Streptomyces sp. NPDC005799]|uniref:hypothetical protein n=1 Tax=Streptomyces sp. NPDC005799 TaxID=3154678 RepID=UPI0033ED0358
MRTLPAKTLIATIRARQPIAGPLVRTAAVVTALSAVATVAIAPAAQAQPGRRLCVYSWNMPRVEYSTSGKRDFHSFVAVDLGKDQGCPVVDQTKFGYTIARSQPVNKITCESWPADLNPWPGNDICKKLQDDAVFEARHYDNGAPLGHAIGGSIFQYQ